ALGILMIGGYGLTGAWGSPRLAGIGPRASLLLVLSLVLAAEARGVRTTIRNWTDSLTLFRHMEKVAPDSYVVHMGLGLVLERASAHDGAILHLRRAIELCPDFADAHYDLGVVLVG